jgi:ketosteroid isomerase-like protein
VSAESVELVRRAYAAWERGDYVPEEFWAQDLQWWASPDDPDTAATRGRDAASAVLHDWLDHLGRYRAEFEFTDAGEEVLVCMRVLLEGAKTPLLAYHACRVDEGKIDRVRAYSHRVEALAAVGLGPA